MTYGKEAIRRIHDRIPVLRQQHGDGLWLRGGCDDIVRFMKQRLFGDLIEMQRTNELWTTRSAPSGQVTLL